MWEPLLALLWKFQFPSIIKNMAVQLPAFKSKLDLKFSYSLRAKSDKAFSCDCLGNHSLGYWTEHQHHWSIRHPPSVLLQYIHFPPFSSALTYTPNSPISENKIQVTFCFILAISNNNQFCLLFELKGSMIQK